MGLIALTGALVVSLLLNLGIGSLFVGERDRLEQAREQIRQLQREIDGEPTPNTSIADLAAAVERIRGLRFRQEVEPQVVPTDTLAQRVRELFVEDTPRDEFDALSDVLETLGVLDSGAGLFDLILASQEEQVIGYYDQRDKALFVAGDSAEAPSPFTRIALAHELTHAVTDQHFDLERLDRLRERGKDDEVSAFLALVEGDATLVMLQYLQEDLTPGEQAAAAAEQGEFSTESYDNMPVFLQEALLFPYAEGLVFARALHERGGYDLIDRAYRDPPTSTEQILHPERYLDSRDDPQEVELPNVRDALGSGWSRLLEGGFGELDLRLLADRQVASGGLGTRDAADAAQGWDGGAYQALTSAAGTLVAALTTWDSEAEATEAERAFSRWLPLRYGNIGSPIEVGSGSGRGWESADGAGFVLRAGSELLILLGPDADSVRDARAAFDGF